MSEIFHELHESELQAEITHHKNEISSEQELIREHTAEEGKGGRLMQDLHKAELHHEEKVLSREEQALEKDQMKLDAVEGHPDRDEEACTKAEEFKKLADEAQDERIIDMDLFETPSQPLK